MDTDNEDVITLKHKPRISERISAFFANPRKRLWFIIISGIILIAAVGTGLYLMTRPDESPPPPENTVTEKKVEPAIKYYNILDGTETEQASANKHPLAIMVENHIDARPQAGLDKASLVYEAIAEGGITRFMALFSSHEADKVGPVRSARPYYVDWALGYNAWYAHVGGNYNALEQIRTDNVADLDQFKYPSNYWRDTSLRVSREHTVFTSTIKLREQAAKLNYSTDNNFRTYKFDPVPNYATPETSTGDTAGPDTPTSSPADVSANKVNVNFSSANYNVSFQYDAASNSYKRTLAGKIQTDRETKSEIAPANLIVMTVKRTPLVTEINERGWLMTTVGEGEAKIFMDGKVIDARWVKNSKTEREAFYDSSNQEITFNRGQFWICVIPPDSSVTYN